MSTIIAIIGESGTGKSSSIRTLDPKTTAIISPINKPLPIKGFTKDYNEKNKNWFVNANATTIVNLMINISDNGKHIKTVIIDDFQYLMSDEFMRRASEVGYKKFTEIGQNAYNVIKGSSELRQDLNVFFLAHEDVSEITGKRKLKTIGKMLDDKVALEGLFTIVLFSEVKDGQYIFKTQNDGTTTAKSPMGMFETLEIPNDLKLVTDTINNYYNTTDEPTKTK